MAVRVQDGRGRWKPTSGVDFFQVVMARPSLLPLWEKVDRMSVSSFETDEGSVSAERTPHPALRATFSHKGRRKKARGEGRALLPRLFAAGLAVALQAVEVHA